jgi:hypothetical protein
MKYFPIFYYKNLFIVKQKREKEFLPSLFLIINLITYYATNVFAQLTNLTNFLGV